MHERKVCNIGVFCLIVMVLTVVDQKHRKKKMNIAFVLEFSSNPGKANRGSSKAGTYTKKMSHYRLQILSSSQYYQFASSHRTSPYIQISFFISSLHRHISLPHTFITYCTHKHFSTVRPTWTLSHEDTFLHSRFFTNTFTNSLFLHAEAATN
jgi:hypothetical protein